MFFRKAGVYHTKYAEDRTFFPIPVDRWMVAGLLLLGLIAPYVVSSLALSTYLLPWLVWTSAVLGLNLVIGWAGQFHFGYAAVMGIGAYTSIHANRFGIPWELSLILGGCMASFIGVGFAFAALRVKGLYLALSTLALQFGMDWVISHVPAISGGTQATLQAPPVYLFGQLLDGEISFYYIALAWCLIVTIFMLNLKRSSLGRALISVREKDFAAAVIGVHSFYYKLIAFSTSSFIGGISGSILIFTFYRAATPEQFSVNISIELLAMVIVGGLGSIIGSFFGAAFILLMPGQMNNFFGWLAVTLNAPLGVETLSHIPNAVYGSMIIIFLLIEPMGLGKLYNNLRDYLLVWPFGYQQK